MHVPTHLHRPRQPPVGRGPSWHPGNGGTLQSFPGYACDVCPFKWMWQCTFSGILEPGRKPLKETSESSTLSLLAHSGSTLGGIKSPLLILQRASFVDGKPDDNIMNKLI